MIASRRAYTIIFLLVTAFILYGSLYPFAFHARPGSALAYLLSTRLVWDHPGDLLSNVLLYIPFGFFGVCAFPRRVLPIIFVGALLATSMELLQFYDRGRVTSMGDVYADSIGAALGAVAASLVGLGMRWPFMRALRADPAAAMVLLMWFGYRLYPYIPVTGPHKYVHALVPVIFAPRPSIVTVVRFVFAWMGIGAVLEALYGPNRLVLAFLLVATAEFLGRVMIIDRVAQLADLLGIAGALLLWLLILRHTSHRLAIVIAAFIAMIVILRLEPFTFIPVPRVFGWVPFLSFMHGSIDVAVQSFCEKFFAYGGLIWLLCHRGLRLNLATALTAALLFATSWAERYVPGRTAEVTDAVMALAIGGAFGLLRQASPRAS